jgi:hypothetical protein
MLNTFGIGGLDGLGYQMVNLRCKGSIKFPKLPFAKTAREKRHLDRRNPKKLILLDKNGGMTEPRDWPHISITSAAYRIFTCSMVNDLQMLDADHGSNLFTDWQNGFLFGITGRRENSVLLDE